MTGPLRNHYAARPLSPQSVLLHLCWRARRVAELPYVPLPGPLSAPTLPPAATPPQHLPPLNLHSPPDWQPTFTANQPPHNHQPPNHNQAPTHVISHPCIPFHRDFTICTWNTRALFAYKTGKRLAKNRFVQMLSRTHDIVILTETHSQVGTLESWVLPDDTVAYMTHGTTRRGGVCVLMHKRLAQHFPHRQWSEITPGRAGVLRCAGPSGSMDIVGAYFNTGLKEQEQDARSLRARLRGDIGRQLRPPQETLTLVAGDFNWTNHPDDRYRSPAHADNPTNVDLADPAADEQEETHWKRCTAAAHIHEWWQPNHTFHSTQGTSRIDRIYTNQHAADQQNHTLTCYTLPRTPLSDHTPLHASRSTPAPRSTPAMEDWVLRHASWPLLTQVCYQDSCLTSPPTSAVEKLARLKKAMWAAARQIQHKSRFRPPTADTPSELASWSQQPYISPNPMETFF